jgi:predicted metal-binding membrane protein
MAMTIVQKVIIISLLLTAGISWLLSTFQPDMMNIMVTYNPTLITLFIATWTAGMAAMMFPAIIPMVLLYNKLLVNKQSISTSEITQLNFLDTFKVIIFVGMYLVVWALTGLGLLLGWSVSMNSLISVPEGNYISIIYGSILIISGIYQFTPLKNKCLGYCESPLSFFMRRWKSGTIGAIKMGAYHGLYCLGCCWPYFLIMVALGWMNLVWMGLFAIIIFGEKIWSKGIWVARLFGISLIIVGISSCLGLITLYDSTMFMGSEGNPADKMVMPPNDKNNGLNNSKSKMSNDVVMPEGMHM